jgi:hypothetical protein
MFFSALFSPICTTWQFDSGCPTCSWQPLFHSCKMSRMVLYFTTECLSGRAIKRGEVSILHWMGGAHRLPCDLFALSSCDNIRVFLNIQICFTSELVSHCLKGVWCLCWFTMLYSCTVYTFV